MTGSEVAVRHEGRTLRAWRPDPLPARDLSLTAATVRKTERARQRLLAADAHTPAAWEPLARVLLRAEGVASSYIEGVRASAADVLFAEANPLAATDPAAWVAANLAVLDTALAHAHGDEPLAAADLHTWHDALMRGHSRLDAHLLGNYRDRQGWIGAANPLEAALVTTPTDTVAPLMDDLLDWCNRRDSDLDPITQAAVAHAQFEIIHPYADGNGRLGRILLLWQLARRLGVRVLPPLSVRLARDPGGYLSGLTLFRLASADAWIAWLADTLADASAAVDHTLTDLAELHGAWAARVDAAGMRADAAARRLLALLPAHPVLTAGDAAALLDTTDRTARTALASLGSLGVLTPYGARDGRAAGRGRPQHTWVASGVLDLITNPGR